MIGILYQKGKIKSTIKNENLFAFLLTEHKFYVSINKTKV